MCLSLTTIMLSCRLIKPHPLALTVTNLRGEMTTMNSCVSDAVVALPDTHVMFLGLGLPLCGRESLDLLDQIPLRIRLETGM